MSSDTTAQERTTTLSVPALTAMVVGSMVGAGVFQLPARFATETGVYGALIAWGVAGLGMLMLAFVFQNLAVRQPDIDNGVYAYARAGFGVYPGFLSAIGFWASACAGNAFYWVLIMSTLSQLFPDLEPLLGQGDTWPAFAISAAAVWGFFFLIRRGVKEAGRHQCHRDGRHDRAPRPFSGAVDLLLRRIRLRRQPDGWLRPARG